ncbi:MAG: efflux RND transporter permease subunit [Candidatus Acidiferrales bacterium]
MQGKVLNSTTMPASVRSAPTEDRSRYWFARHAKSIIFLVLILAIIGVYETLSIPIAVFPATNFPRIIIGVDNGVMPIDQMEVTITRPLEGAVNSVPGLEDVRSITSRGSAEIDLFFNWEVDMPQTLLQVNAAVSRIQSTLPPTAQIESHRLDFASFPILGYSLTSDKVPQSQLWELATYELKPRLNRLTGVASVLVQGGQIPEFQVTPDPARMLRSHVTLQDILDAVNHTNLIDSPGLLSRNHQLFLGLVTAQVRTPEEIGDIVIKNVNDVPVRIRDVGAIAPSTAPAYTVVTANGKPAVLLSISRQPDSNTVQVANEVHLEIQNLRSTLPSGVELRVFYDQSNIVRQSIASVRDAIIIGLFLTGFIIWLFLRDLGTAVLAGVVVPVTICVTFVALKIMGQSFNMMTLGGLAAAGGLVIDDAIVVVENIVLHRDGGEGPLEATRRALKELTIPLIGSTLTPIVVFLPLISITGVTGTFFRALATAMSVSLLTSLVLALAWTTNLGTYLIRHKKTPGAGDRNSEREADENSLGIPQDPARGLSAESSQQEEIRRMLAAEEASVRGGVFERILKFYERWMRRALEHPGWLAGFCAILIVVSYVCYNSLGSDLLPAMDEGGFVLDYVMPPGSSLEETNRVISHVEQIVRAVPEVESTSRRTGLQLGLAAVTEPNTGDIAVKLKDKRSRNIDETIAEVRANVRKEEPALDIDFTQVLQDMIGDLTGAPQPIVVKLFSPDAALLATWAPQVADALAGISVSGKKPVVDIQNGIENTTSGPAVVFTVNPQTASKAGFTTDQLAIAASTIVDGEPATTPVVINDRPYTLRVRFPETNRGSLESMSNTVLVNSAGGTATLGSMATITELPGQTEIRRENLQRDVEPTARLEGLDLGSGVAAVQKAVRDLKLPASIRVEYGGTYKEQQKSFHDLIVVLLLALVLIFLVLLFEFRSFSAPLAILSSAVLSTSGVFFALLITRTTFNVSSFMGLIMVVGIVAKNGILLLDANQRFRAAGFSAEEAMVQAGRRRLRPIVMTAMAAVAGMLPLSLALGAGSQMLQPLAIAVIGGILISMVLSLIITPAMEFYLTRERQISI